MPSIKLAWQKRTTLRSLWTLEAFSIRDDPLLLQSPSTDFSPTQRIPREHFLRDVLCTDDAADRDPGMPWNELMCVWPVTALAPLRDQRHLLIGINSFTTLRHFGCHAAIWAQVQRHRKLAGREKKPFRREMFNFCNSSSDIHSSVDPHAKKWRKYAIAFVGMTCVAYTVRAVQS